jgi:hypothetical protein
MKTTVLLSSALLLILPTYSYGYLDPGAGSYALQVLAAALLGTLFSLRIYWKRIKDFIKRIFGSKN